MAILPKVKLKALVSFPSNVLDGVGTDVEKVNGAFKINLAYDDFAPPVGGISDAAHQNALLWNDITKSYVLAPISLIGSGGSVPEAPNDGVQYGRQSLTWTPIVASGGGTPSDINPVMDGVAAPGVAALYSRGDHVHPSDTSRAAVSHTHTASQVTDFSEAVDDRVGALLVAGTNITLTYNDPSNTLTITSTASGGGGGGDVVGPSSAVNNNLAAFDTTTGKLIKDSGVSLAAAQGAVRYDNTQSLTAAQQTIARQNIYAAPFDAMAYNGMQINGSMDVSQELGNAGIAFPAGLQAGYIADGWVVSKNTPGGINAFQNTVGGPSGIPCVMNVAPAVAHAPLTSGQYILLLQRIEGYRIARLAWGTVNAQPVTVGFWIAAPVIGTYFIYGTNWDASVTTAKQSVTTTATGWQWVTATIPGQTTGTWKSDNGIGLELRLELASPATPHWLGSTSNAITITGVVVLPGIEAPSAARSPLIMRPFDQELVTCQRYYWKYLGGIANNAFGSGVALGATTGIVSIRFPVTMRATPSLAYSALSDFVFVFGTTPTSMVLDGASVHSCSIAMNTTGLTSAGAAYLKSANTNAAIMFDARL